MKRPPPSPTEAERAELTGRAGLCASCRHLQLLRSPNSLFVRCARSDHDTAFPRYPPLPVFACPGHAPTGEVSG